ncbi:hypothetical protein IJE86_03705 [bacterium]|nr:hypothetical protein [bacterium]
MSIGDTSTNTNTYIQMRAEAERLAKQADKKQQEATQAEATKKAATIPIGNNNATQDISSAGAKTAQDTHAESCRQEAEALRQKSQSLFAEAERAENEAKTRAAIEQKLSENCSTIDAKKSSVSSVSSPSILNNESTDTVGDKLELTSKDVTSAKSDADKVRYSKETTEAAGSVIDDWNKNQNADRPDGRKHYDNLRSQGLSEAEAARHLYQDESRWANEDAKYLAEQFAQNPELRNYYSENFAQLPPRLQKAMLVDMQNRVQNGEKIPESEILQMAANVKNSEDPAVKAFAMAMLEGFECVSAENKRKFAQYINATEEDIAQSRARSAYESASVLTSLTESKHPRHGRLAVRYNVNQCEQYQRGGADTITSSSSYKNHPEVQQAYANSISQYHKSVQVYAHKSGIDSQYTTEESMNLLNAQIQYMHESNQKQAFSNADNSERMTVENRKFLSSQIKFLAEKNQSYAMTHMMRNEKNLTNKEIMTSIANEVSQLKVDVKEQQKLFEELKMTGTVDSAVLNKVENKMLLNAMAQSTGDATDKAAEARAALIDKIYKFTGSKELAYSIASGELTKNGVTISKFADLLDRGILSPELVVAAGFKNSLMSNFSSFSIAVQERVFDSLSNSEILEMKEKGRFPARFEDKVKARLVVDMNTETAFELARTGDFYDLMNYSQSAKEAKHQNILQKALVTRFSDRMNGSIFGQGKMLS